MRYKFQAGDQVYEVTLERQGNNYQATVNGEPCAFEVLDNQPGQISLNVAGKPVSIYWAEEHGEKWVALNGCTYRLTKPQPRAARTGGEPGAGEAVRAPMPAQVRAVQVDEGDAVEQGQTLLLLEAMKMEIRVKAPAKGHVRRVLVTTGQAVEKDQVLAQIGE